MAPIYDWDGTANNEIGKLYDWDGTTNNQIGKVYDYDGTTNNLIYTAEYVFFPSTYVCDKDNWTDHGEGSGTFTITDTSIYLYGYSGGSGWSLRDYYVDFSKYKSLYFTVTSINNNSQWSFRWRESEGGYLRVDIDINDLAENERIGTHYVDISNINDLCYITFKFEHGGGGTITKIWFEE